jgi:hypothetical protein
MQSSDMKSLVSPAGAGALSARPMQHRAKGGHDKPKHETLIIAAMPAAPAGALAQSAKSQFPVRTFNRADLPWLMETIERQDQGKTPMPAIQKLAESILSLPNSLALRSPHAGMAGIFRGQGIIVPFFVDDGQASVQEAKALIQNFLDQAKRRGASAAVFPGHTPRMKNLQPLLAHMGAQPDPPGMIMRLA